jgi:SAM-dependent methyltransferase
MADRSRAREIANEFLDRNDPKGWFEALYKEAQGDPKKIPWADMAPNPNLVEWLDKNSVSGAGKKALVSGCGLGDDAEELSKRGFDVTACDISAEAIAWCQRRFPNSKINYVIADICRLPEDFSNRYDFALEISTLQVLPGQIRPNAMDCLARALAADGRLLIIARGRNALDHPGNMPWPLTREEVRYFTRLGLEEVRFEDYLDNENPPVRRFRIEYHKKPR